MKKIAAYILLFITITSLFACSKASSSNATPVVFAAKVNGVAWSTTSASVSFQKVPSLRITIHATTNNTAINIDLYPYTGKGIYPIASNNNSYYSAGSNIDHANTGQVEITDSYTDTGNTTIIKGTFNFVADNNVTVTDGAFTVALNLD